ncbi:hypothetical protein D3C81_09240 [compost metagenome]
MSKMLNCTITKEKGVNFILADRGLISLLVLCLPETGISTVAKAVYIKLSDTCYLTLKNRDIEDTLDGNVVILDRDESLTTFDLSDSTFKDSIIVIEKILMTKFAALRGINFKEVLDKLSVSTKIGVLV